MTFILKSLAFSLIYYYNISMYNNEQEELNQNQIINESSDECSCDNSISEEQEESLVKKKSLAKKNAVTLTKKLTLTAVLTGLSFGLYMLGPLCKLPFMFPIFFDLQFSELPALIGGFALGPLYGCIIIILKCALKLPMSKTLCVGELCDCILGLVFVLTSSLIYYFHKNKKGAVISLVFGSVGCVITSIILNYFVNIPFYVQLFYEGNWDGLLKTLSVLFPNITRDNLYAYYIPLSVIPFNILRTLITSFVTFAVYKKVSILFKRFTG